MVVCSVRYTLPFINGIEATCPFTPEVDKDSEEDMVEFHSDATNDEDRIPLITDILQFMVSSWDGEADIQTVDQI